MRSIFFILSLSIVISCDHVLTSSRPKIDTDIPVKNVTLNISSARVPVGETVHLIATIEPSNAANKDLTWSSSNEHVATVDASGFVSAHNAGTAIITVTTADRGRQATCSIQVNDTLVPVTGVTLDTTTSSLSIDGTVLLTAIIQPINATSTGVTWSSNNESVATVNDTGLVTGHAVGTAIITVTTIDGGYTASCTVQVYNSTIPVLGVGLTVHDTTIVRGLTQQLIFEIYPPQASNQAVEWSSDNSSVASVDENGLVTANNEGTTVITVTTNDGGFQDQCEVEVIDWAVPVPLPPVTNNRIFLPAAYPDGENNYGYSVASAGDGSTIAVGMPQVDLTYDLEGSIVVYNYDGSDWSHETINMPTTSTNPYFSTTNPRFGASLAMSGDGSVIVSGFRYSFNDPLFVFHRSGDTWSYTELPGMSGEGLDLSADGSVIAAGHCYINTTAINGDGVGMVHIYRHDGSDWQHEVDLYSDYSGESNHFGYSLDLSSDGTLLVASSFSSISSYGNIIHLFEFDGSEWLQQRLPDNGQRGLGESVSISPDKNLILVGAPGQNGSDGMCLVYTRQPDNTWSLTEISPPGPVTMFEPYYFGWRVFSLSDTSFIAGSKKYVISHPETGYATATYHIYLYTLVDDEWQYEKIIPESGYYGDYFGNSFAVLQDGIFLVGAPVTYQITDYYNPVGAVYLYSYE